MTRESRTDPTTVLCVTAQTGPASDLQQAVHGGDEAELVTVTTGDDAVEAITRSTEVDCVVSDYELPESDGLVLLERIREVCPDLPFVLWTDSGSESVASRAIAAGVTDYVPRETDPADGVPDLAERLQAALDDGNRSDNDRSDGGRSDGGRSDDRGPTAEPASDGDRRTAADERPSGSGADEPRDGTGTDQPRDDTETERERRYRTLVENLPGIVYRAAVDPSWPFEYVHGDCEAITGYAADELRDEVDWGYEIIHEDDRDLVVGVVEDAIEADEPFEVTYRIRRRDGTVRWLWERGQAVRDGVLEGFITDVTEQTERKRELERTRGLLDDAERLAGVGAWEYDLEADAVTWTDGTRRIYEVAPDYEPSYESALEFCHPEDRDRIRRLVSACRERGESYSTQFRIVTAAGRERWIHAEAKQIEVTDQRGRIRGYVQDVTERKRRDQQVAVLDRVLRHNLRNDMNAILGHAEEISEAGDERAADAAETVRSIGSNLVVLANKHREIATLVSEPQRERQFRVPDVIERPVEQMRDTYPRADLSTTVRGEGTVAASSELEEAVAELVENGIQHSDRERPSVEVTADAGADRLVLRVADDGPGIPDREREQIESGSEVEPLYHSEGLGLWLAKWIVNRSGGTLSFEANEPRGTVVEATIPRETGRTLVDADEGQDLQESGRGR